MFDNISASFNNALKSLRGRGLLTEKQINDTLANLRLSLIESDVNLEVIDRFLSIVRTKALAVQASQSLNPAQQVAQIVFDELTEILGKDYQRKLNFAKNPPTVIMLAGLQGSGKTTFAGKLAKYFQKQGNTPLLVAADLQRPNAVTQLQLIGEQIDVEVFAPDPGVQSTVADATEVENENSNIKQSTAAEAAGVNERKGLLGRLFSRKGDPVEVAKQGVEYAKQKLFNIVIVDTAGRLNVDREMMEQAADIEKALEPNETLFVIDSLMGQEVASTAKTFADTVHITGVVLTKLDSDARGGAALSVVSVTQKPILFASVGERLDDLQLFYPERMASRILELGDVMTLIEQAQDRMDQTQVDQFSQKLVAGENFDFNDFLAQLEQVQKMGNLKSMMSLIPGMRQYKQAVEQFDEKDLNRTRAIVLSMTPEERRNPDLLNGSRKKRIAQGSGTKITDVNALIERFGLMNKMTQSVMSGGKKKMPKGIPPEFAKQAISGLKVSPPSTSKNKKKKKFGNPAKQAEYERSLASKN
ncbi:MAG: signal recognition particle protein Srp54 [Bifidobacteriaceae bacterium]|jgi:signal recognition particle subunit SRP54|nr:signal recognition particle protein Srp54 [Bifidobacteriaceae bacterium]